jgi:hypothetical protein
MICMSMGGAGKTPQPRAKGVSEPADMNAEG